MDEPTLLQCPECDVHFYVVWNRDPVYDRPEYCPFCGTETDYAALEKESEKGWGTDTL